MPARQISRRRQECDGHAEAHLRQAIVSPIENQKTAMMISAAPVIRRAVDPTPKVMAASLSRVSSATGGKHRHIGRPPSR
jgi:hypothetical protein